MSIDVDDLGKGLGLIERLTISKLFIGFVAAVMCILLFAITEHRAEAYALLTTSFTLQVIIGIMIVLTGIGACLSGLIKYVDSTRDALYNSLRDQITDLRQEINAVEIRERECNQQRLLESQERARDRDAVNVLMSKLVEKGLLEDRRSPL